MAVGGSFDTFPKLLARNAAQFSSRPAFRHKDLGIWQTWSWAQVAEIVRAYAAGLHRLGLQPGDTIAIVGSNRPKLYWTLMAAQALRAIPVPVFSDAVADELAYVLAHADVKFVAAQDQEQVDKVFSVSDRVPHLHRVVYDEPRAIGREAIQSSTQTAMAGWSATMRAGIKVTNIRFVKPDVAIVETVATFNEGDVRENRGTAVMVREAGNWLDASLRVFVAEKK